MLIISADSDHTVPWAIANASYKKEKRNKGVDRNRQDAGPWARAYNRRGLA